MTNAEILARIAAAKALAERGEPHTPESLAEYNTARAREMARAEARRQAPTPQAALPLDKAA